jgi:hypothetical protein
MTGYNTENVKINSIHTAKILYTANIVAHDLKRKREPIEGISQKHTLINERPESSPRMISSLSLAYSMFKVIA